MARHVLITGAAGFLGQHVAQHFANAGWITIGVDDIPPDRAVPRVDQFLRMRLPSAEFPNLLRETPPEVCVHCAGCASVGHSMTDPATDFLGNVVLTFEVLEALRRHAPRCRLLFLSSAAVYGDPSSLPVVETHPVHPLSPYGYHKRQAELLCEEYARIYGLPTAVVRIFSAYGPGLRRQVIWDTCAKVLSTGQLTLHGTGRESRDFIHARDLARALYLLAERAPAQGEIYNLASGVEITIDELAQIVVQALGVPCVPVFDGHSMPGNPLQWRADVSRIGQLGFAPEISLESGIREVAEWCRTVLEK